MVLANIFQPLIDIFGPVLLFFHGIIGGSWGWSIIALTVVVRALLLPLAFKQMHSTQKLQQVAPQMKAIHAKYKDDKQRQQQEIMKFYKENEINPFASLLALVAQVPVFIGLFYTLRTRLRQDICPGLQAAYRHAYALHHNIPLKDTAGHTTVCHGLEWIELAVYPRPDQHRHRPDPGRADRAVRRDAARVEPDDAGADDGSDSAASDAAAAAVLRDLHHQLPCWVDRLLDHHQHLDNGPAMGNPVEDRSGRAGDSGRSTPSAGGCDGRRAARAANGDGSGGGGRVSGLRRGTAMPEEKQPAAVGSSTRTRHEAPLAPARKRKKR
jgi:YidC/Oxa1 family membrane protein insertase